MKLLEKNLLPDFLIRWGIRRLLRSRLRELEQKSTTPNYLQDFVRELKDSPIAVQTQDANDQHYEVPPKFFKLCLGPNLKYSCGHFKDFNQTLEQGEQQALDLVLERAQLQDGMKILELGCGWGSLTVWMARKFPRAQITALSNSQDQMDFITERLERENLTNVKLVKKDMKDFKAFGQFDRAVSIEMFEHMRNYEMLLKEISACLTPEGKLFVHIFVHKDTPYLFTIKDKTDWMSQYFFSGGMMPSDRLLYQFNQDLKVVDHWKVAGTHYAKTADSWLENMDRNATEIKDIFRQFYGPQNLTKWWIYWRVFFMSCSELWNWDSGKEWFVSHYLLSKEKT